MTLISHLGINCLHQSAELTEKIAYHVFELVGMRGQRNVVLPEGALMLAGSAPAFKSRVTISV